MASETTKSEPWVSASCRGETCSMCGEPAVAKVGEEIMSDDPHPHRHNLTAYVCPKHFGEIFGPRAARRFQPAS